MNVPPTRLSAIRLPLFRADRYAELPSLQLQAPDAWAPEELPGEPSVKTHLALSAPLACRPERASRSLSHRHLARGSHTTPTSSGDSRVSWLSNSYICRLICSRLLVSSASMIGFPASNISRSLLDSATKAWMRSHHRVTSSPCRSSTTDRMMSVAFRAAPTPASTVNLTPCRLGVRPGSLSGVRSPAGAAEPGRMRLSPNSAACSAPMQRPRASCPRSASASMSLDRLITMTARCFLLCVQLGESSLVNQVLHGDSQSLRKNFAPCRRYVLNTALYLA